MVPGSQMHICAGVLEYLEYTWFWNDYGEISLKKFFH